MSPHSLELLHPTEPPERRALRLVVLTLALALLVGVLAVLLEPRASRHATTIEKPSSNEKNP